MEALLNVPYHSNTTRDPLRELDLYYTPSSLSSLPPLLCFVHGGAWRSEDKTDHSALARALVSSSLFPVAVANYRLTQAEPSHDDTVLQHLQHPQHAEDVLEMLGFLTSWEDLGYVFDRTRIYLIGHSCSAHMLASILLDSSSVSPSLTPSPTVLDSVQGVILSEGIYDIDQLLVTFPQYGPWFIQATFGNKTSYAEFAITRLALRNEAIRWLVIHSNGDTLIDRSQSEAMYSHLTALYSGTADSHVSSNMDELDAEHNDILLTDTYLRIVTDFVMRNSKTDM